MDKSSHGLWPGELKNIDNVKGISSSFIINLNELKSLLQLHGNE
jgi:hypothetical protein